MAYKLKQANVHAAAMAHSSLDHMAGFLLVVKKRNTHTTINQAACMDC
jgi:hypothetical protein